MLPIAVELLMNVVAFNLVRHVAVAFATAKLLLVSGCGR